MPKQQSRKEAYWAWLNMDGGERLRRKLPHTETDMSEFLGVSKDGLVAWKAEYQARKVQAKDDEEWKRQNGDNEDEIEAVIQNLKNLSKTNAFAGKTYLQLMGKLDERRDTSVKIDGGFIARAIIRAERELGEGGYGEIGAELSLLPPELDKESSIGKEGI